MECNKPPRGRIFTVGQAFPDKTGYQPQTFYNAIHSGTGELSRLPYYRIGRTIRIAEEDIERFLEGRRVAPRTGTPD